MIIAIVFQPVCDVINFENSLIFLIKLFFDMTGKQEWEELLMWKKKHFSSILKNCQLLKIVSDLRVPL